MINLTKKNDFYRLSEERNGNIIIADFRLGLSDEYQDKEINLDSKDMSKDGIIFMNELFPTLTSENPIIGVAYVYEDHTCIEHFLVEAIIDSDNFTEAKRLIEHYFS